MSGSDGAWWSRPAGGDGGVRDRAAPRTACRSTRDNRGREPDSSSERRTKTFTGEVWSDPVLSGVEGVAINNVFFAPGGRTHWHRHDGAQILCVVGGRGHAYTREGEGGEIGWGTSSSTSRRGRNTGTVPTPIPTSSTRR